ncbi:carotenoid 1,2-hydratase [Paucibacter sp. KBW04]|uniref:lipocalin-like domain-containing protein n=1 Tax=Paucibacter sp. KBW04 TaxID=2153361 RepID=UPI000F55D3B3|nr:lipocalin-like domain-containing protein [Paucibacter sp. KBW04]RQO58627.1 carotenoid 1,2-hydratase [Paucibacter sp. KBW04]
MIARRHLLALAALAAGPGLAAQSPRLQFPRDFGAHTQTRLEWWYLTGVLFAEDQVPDPQAQPLFGYQLTFFRLKGPAAAEHPSALAARQLMIGHVALSDLRQGRLLHDQRLSRVLPGLAQASEADCSLQMRDWRLRREPGESAALSRYQAFFQSQAFALDLQLQSQQPPLLQGDEGISRKGPGAAQFSHYYSQVQLLTQAKLRLDGREQRLRGLSWLDQEWSDQLLGPADQAHDQAVGWDWAGLNLFDGSALTVFRLRRADGSVLWSGGSWRSPQGQTRNFAPHELQMEALRHWRSPSSAASYPVEWRLRTPVGEFRLDALLDAQEVDARLSTGMRYWEGAAALRAEASIKQAPALGLGYLEMTGYAGPMRLG